MNQEWIVNSPLSIPISKNKKFALNLNTYRNAHYAILNKAKRLYEDCMSPKLTSIPKLKSCSLIYILYVPTKRKLDVSNVCSVVDKFFSDTLVLNGKLEDDNYHYLKSITYRFGGIDRANPRVEIHIIED